MNDIDNDTKSEIAEDFISGGKISNISKKHGLPVYKTEEVIRLGFKIAILLCEDLTQSAKRQNTH